MVSSIKQEVRKLDFTRMSAMVLAGGRSRRMGTDKAELRLDGVSMIELQIRKLRHLGIRDIMLSGYSWPVRGCRNVADLFPHRGPLSGVHACLLAAQYDACLVLSVDMPLIPEETLCMLAEAHRGGVTLLEHGERIEPLAAVYDRAAAAQAGELLKTEKTAMMRLLDRLPTQTVRYTGDENLLTNCNTPEDYDRIRNLYKQLQHGENRSPEGER